MKIGRKLVKRAIAVGLVLVISLAVGLVLFMDYAVKKSLEVGGGLALGVETKLDSVSVGVFSSSLAVRGLQIANPEGYKTDRLMALDELRVVCGIGSLLGDEIAVREIILEAPEVTLELKTVLPFKSNIGELVKRLKSLRRDDSESKKRFRIDRIQITGAKLRCHLFGGKTLDLTLPDIELKDVRNKDGTPMVLEDVFRYVLVSIGSAALARSKEALMKEVLEQRVRLQFGGGARRFK